MRIAVSIATAVVLAATPALACSPRPDAPSYEQRLAAQPVVFTGRVTAILTAQGMKAQGGAACGTSRMPYDTCVVFKVEQSLLGVRGGTFKVPQGDGSDCGISFTVGDYWLFAGHTINDASQKLKGPLGKSDLSAIKRMLGQ